MASSPRKFPNRFLDKKELKHRVLFSSQHFQRLEEDGKFPKRAYLGPNRVGWFENEVDDWINERKLERDLGLEPLSLANWNKPSKPNRRTIQTFINSLVVFKNAGGSLSGLPLFF